MLKRFVKFICVVLCIAMLLPFTAVAEGNTEWFGELPPIQEITHHIDITDGSWYANNCRYVYHNGLMVGTSETEFSPHEVLTREMAVVILAAIVRYQYNELIYYHELKKDLPEYTYSSFKDVEVGKWYSNSIQWAYERGLVSGIGEGYFGVGQPITREEFIIMLFKPLDETIFDDKYDYRYLGEEYISSAARISVGFFTNVYGYDIGTYPWYSLESIPHIITGYPDGLYHFKDTITRAEAATMVAIYSHAVHFGDFLFQYPVAAYSLMSDNFTDKASNQP